MHAPIFLSLDCVRLSVNHSRHGSPYMYVCNGIRNRGSSFVALQQYRVFPLFWIGVLTSRMLLNDELTAIPQSLKCDQSCLHSYYYSYCY